MISGIVIAGILAITPVFVHLFREMHTANVALTAFGTLSSRRDYGRAYNMTTPAFHAAISKPTLPINSWCFVPRLGTLKEVSSGASETEGNAKVDRVNN